MADKLIAQEIYVALERLDADERLLAIIGSWEDAVDDDQILAVLKHYNGTDKESDEPQ